MNREFILRPARSCGNARVPSCSSFEVTVQTSGVHGPVLNRTEPLRTEPAVPENFPTVRFGSGSRNFIGGSVRFGSIKFVNGSVRFRFQKI